MTDGADDGVIDGITEGAEDGVTDGEIDGAEEGVTEGATDGAGVNSHKYVTVLHWSPEVEAHPQLSEQELPMAPVVHIFLL